MHAVHVLSFGSAIHPGAWIWYGLPADWVRTAGVLASA